MVFVFRVSFRCPGLGAAPEVKRFLIMLWRKVPERNGSGRSMKGVTGFEWALLGCVVVCLWVWCRLYCISVFIPLYFGCGCVCAFDSTRLDSIRRWDSSDIHSESERERERELSCLSGAVMCVVTVSCWCYWERAVLCLYRDTQQPIGIVAWCEM